MKAIKGFLVVLKVFAQYFAYKLRLCPPPGPEGNEEGVFDFLGLLLGWNKYLRIVNGDQIPTDHPAIFYGNHFKLDDPFYMFKAVFAASDGKVTLHAMMRNDFFKWKILRIFKSPLLDLDELLDFLGAHGIGRDNVTLPQLKIFLEILKNEQSFTLYPGRTRSCSGLVMDYRDRFQEPGGISFFIHMTQTRHPDIKVSAVPSSRNYNVVTKHTSVIFGAEQFLKAGATRDEQRAFDAHLVEVMSDLVEINVPQLVAALLYTRCLHGLKSPIALEDIREIVASIVNELGHRYVDPEDAADVPTSVDAAVRYFKIRGMLKRKDAKIIPNVEKILSVPELTKKYRKQNPVKYLTNQILHLGDVTGLIEAKVLGYPMTRATTPFRKAQ